MSGLPGLLWRADWDGDQPFTNQLEFMSSCMNRVSSDGAEDSKFMHEAYEHRRGRGQPRIVAEGPGWTPSRQRRLCSAETGNAQIYKKGA